MTNRRRRHSKRAPSRAKWVHKYHNRGPSSADRGPTPTLNLRAAPSLRGTAQPKKAKKTRVLEKSCACFAEGGRDDYFIVSALVVRFFALLFLAFFAGFVGAAWAS